MRGSILLKLVRCETRVYMQYFATRVSIVSYVQLLALYLQNYSKHLSTTA